LARASGGAINGARRVWSSKPSGSQNHSALLRTRLCSLSLGGVWHKFRAAHFANLGQRIFLIVDFRVLFWRDDLQILQPIVPLVSVDVVDKLPPQKWTPDKFLHDAAMLVYLLSVFLGLNVRMLHDSYSQSARRWQVLFP
jgi:hypothetical protein